MKVQFFGIIAFLLAMFSCSDSNFSSSGTKKETKNESNVEVAFVDESGGAIDISGNEIVIGDVKLDSFFKTAEGKMVRSGFKVTNAESFTFHWRSLNTDECNVFSKGESEARPGTDLEQTDTIGEVKVKRITEKTYYRVVCTYEDEAGNEKEINKVIDAEVSGGWYDAYQQVCSTFCSSQSMINIASPDGLFCVSGENRRPSAIGIVNFSPTGCWHTCSAPEGGLGATSEGSRCYHPSQKRDHDSTDKTLGCYCKEAN